MCMVARACNTCAADLLTSRIGSTSVALTKGASAAGLCNIHEQRISTVELFLYQVGSVVFECAHN